MFVIATNNAENLFFVRVRKGIGPLRVGFNRTLPLSPVLSIADTTMLSIGLNSQSFCAISFGVALRVL
jgi:hypothetical protein